MFRKISGREELDRIKSKRYDPYSYESNSSNILWLSIFLFLWSICSLILSFQDLNLRSMFINWESEGINSLPPSTFDPDGLIEFSKKEGINCVDIRSIVNEMNECSITLGYYNEFSNAQDISLVIFFIIVVILFICIFLFGSFIHRASRNLLTLQTKDQRFSPEMSVIWFFVPIMNFFRPWQIIKELFKGSDPGVDVSMDWRADGLIHYSVHIWGLFYFLVWIFNPVTVSRIWFNEINDISDVIIAYNALVISDVFLSILGFLAIFVIIKLHVWQQHKRELVGFIEVQPKIPLDPIEELLNDIDKKSK